MTIQTFPTTPIPSFVYIYNSEYNTLVTPFEGANEQRVKLQRFPKRSVEISYNKINIDTVWYTLHDFFTERAGAYESFWFLDFRQRQRKDEYVGRGNGATTTFDLHSKTTIAASYDVFVNGVEATEATDYVFSPGGGAAGADQIVFQAGHIPASGALITSNFKGYLRIKARLPDKWSDSWYEHLRTKLSLLLTEVQW